MNLMTTSLTTLAAGGLLAVASVAASACDFHKNHVTAAASPVIQEDVAAPATTVDPMRVADAAKAVLVPVAPREETLTETD
jgi:hypothetical protein